MIAGELFSLKKVPPHPFKKALTKGIAKGIAYAIPLLCFIGTEVLGGP